MEQQLLAFFQQHRQKIEADIKTLVLAQAGSTELSALRHTRDTLVSLIYRRTGILPVVHSGTGGHDCVSFSAFSGEKQILLVGHYDTVHSAGSFELRQEQDRLYGPGVLDMKGGIVAAIWIIHAFRSLKIEPGKELLCFFNSDEEIGSEDSSELLYAMAVRASAALVLEPAAGEDLKTGRKGQMEITVRVEGRSSHAGAHHEKGINAIEELAHEILAFQAMTDYSVGTTVNVGVCSGGSVPNIVPDEAEARLDCRYSSLEEYEVLRKKIEALPVSVPGTIRSVTVRRAFPPMEQTEQNLTLFSLACQAAENLGITVGNAFVGGRSDGNLLSGRGIPVLDGLGLVGSGIHTKEEYILLSRIPERYALTAGLILRIK